MSLDGQDVDPNAEPVETDADDNPEFDRLVELTRRLLTPKARADTWPDHGTITVRWEHALIDGKRDLSYRVHFEPAIDQAAAITIFRDLAQDDEDQLEFVRLSEAVPNVDQPDAT